MSKRVKTKINRNLGFTLAETLVGVFVFTTIALAVYQGLVSVTDLVKASRARTVATLLANEQVELIRNLPYQSVGIVGGLPNGVLPHVQTFLRSGITFTATTTIRNIDHPFDGVIGGTPNDLSPADHKLVEVLINCSGCKLLQPLAFTTTVAPRGLETGTGNGALFTQVLNANGQPVSGANVRVENSLANPAIVIEDVTNNNGLLQLVDVPPGNFAYQISVNKGGYSSSQTYQPGAVGNPNPVNPHSTVLAGQVTQLTLAIDQVSTLNLSAINNSCSAISGAEINLRGNKLLGTSPDVWKYDVTHVLDGSGQKTVSDLEWDNYDLAVAGANHDLSGSVPLLPLAISPNTTQNVSLVLAPKNPNALLVTVKDASSGLPLSDATVELSRGASTQTLLTDRGFFRQSDWSGGSGQDNFVDSAFYYSDDGNVDNTNFLGQLKLRFVFDDYVSSGTLTSSIFDTGSTTESTFHNLSWSPAVQDPLTGADSVKFQIATASSTDATWEYLGPDGTTASFYTISGQNINAVHNGDRYVRYRIFLTTADTTVTPTVSEVALTYGSGCLPFGQVFFNGLTSASDYALTVSKAGYQTYQNNATNVTSSWQSVDVSLLPQ